MRQINAAAGGTTPVTPPPPPPRDIVDVLVGGAPFTDDYGFKSPTDLPYYSYFIGHGGRSDQHTGIDVTGYIGEPLYSPISGTVVCAGTNTNVPGAHGSSCAAFPFTLGVNTSTSGRCEILSDDGSRSLILGHVLRTILPIGSRVKPGDHLADMGGQNGPHCHLESRLWDGGNYTIVDPRQAFGSVSVALPVERVPYNFDMEIQPAPNLFTVTALQDVKVYQRADPSAAILDTIKAGEQFEAIAIIPGNDGKQWWLGRYQGRVPMDGTKAA